MLAIVKSVLLAPLYAVLSAALLLQLREGLTHFSSLAAKSTQFLSEDHSQQIAPFIAKINAFLGDAFGKPDELRISLVHILLLSNLLVLLTLSVSSPPPAKRK